MAVFVKMSFPSRLVFVRIWRGWEDLEKEQMIKWRGYVLFHRSGPVLLSLASSDVPFPSLSRRPPPPILRPSRAPSSSSCSSLIVRRLIPASADSTAAHLGVFSTTLQRVASIRIKCPSSAFPFSAIFISRFTNGLWEKGEFRREKRSLITTLGRYP